MSYSGFLIKVGSAELPMKYISRGSYKATAEKQIAYSYTDANGDAHYEIMPHRKLNVEFSLSDCTQDIYTSIINMIKNAFVNSTEEKLLVTAYVPELDGYISQYCMFQNESPSVFDAKSQRLIYQGIKIVLKGYGGAV